MIPHFITACTDGVRIDVHAQPGAKKTELLGLHGNAVKIRVKAPPVDGAANAELARFLGDLFKIKLSQVTLLRGEKSRSKTFELSGVDALTAASILAKT